MSLDSDNLAERFAHVFDAPEPATDIDPHNLLEAGRRIKRQRRRTRQITGSAAGLVCLLAAGAFVLTASHPTGRTPDTTTSEAGDPLTIQADFTWLPGPTRSIQYSSGSLRGSGYVDHTWSDGTIPVTEDLTWNTTPDPIIRKLKSAGTVNGQAAYYTSDGALYFKSPAGQWAELTAAALPGGNAAPDYGHVPVATELAIARSVRFAPREIALPIRIDDADAKPSRVTFSTQGNDAWTLQLAYTEGPIDITIDVKPGKPYPTNLGVELNYYVSTHTFKDAAKASNGLGINIEMASLKQSAPGDPTAYLSRITSLGLDPADWTTHPIGN
ncbi:hypothetical protein KDK95_11600 [Actinospica sp. MGRD01-02]|uniref:Uncharacterized protein n=1 Tax=Actinospica acidithermotolerans TaxID=2828514 RepID=A0A941IG16_9ACTN|nr:hypothetical protein [Actinospica acidithermotolerans]MBR7826950.1 hypothetical protein [Actinospica acidithermotolerans]